jgi:hypothetical protein
MVLVSPANAEEKPNDAAALAGLDSVKTVFLVNRDDARTTAGYLKGIRATHESLVQQGVAPSTVLVFLGKAVQFITTQPEESIATEQRRRERLHLLDRMAVQRLRPHDLLSFRAGSAGNGISRHLPGLMARSGS